MKVRIDLRKVMQKYGYKQKELAEAAGLSPVTISNICRGACLPSVQSLISMSEQLDIPIYDFFSMDEPGPGTAPTATMICPYCKSKIGVNMRFYLAENKKDE